MKNNYSLGIDFGTNSVRALILDLNNGVKLAMDVQPYPSGNQGILLDVNNHHVARQNPADYLISMEKAVKNTVNSAKEKGIDVSLIKGIGIDATASTPLPVDKNITPLAFYEKFKNNMNAQAWLWKDHSSAQEASAITELAEKIRPEYLKKCGGAYSSEWFFSKILHCLKNDKEVFDAAYSWIELSDYIPAVISGIKNVEDVKRNICAAGHKAMFSEQWGGLPDKEFLALLAPELAQLKDKLFEEAYSFETLAGNLSKDWAVKFGLNQGIPVAVGSIDAHTGAVGAGVGKNSMVKIIGTSTCDIMVHPEDEKINDIEGVSGMVNGSVLPGYIGIEAGQAAVGDIFNWFVNKVLNKEESYHKTLTEKAKRLKAGESGLLCLDWNNGNRNILADPHLTGLIIGQTINTTDYEIYRALIEATAFGARVIIERMEESGINIEKMICCGGISQKNRMLMQIYADVLQREIEIADSEQTVAVGAAIMGAYTAMKEHSGFETVSEIQKRVCKIKNEKYIPQKSESKTYQELYVLYKTLHNSFGIANESKNINLFSVMKDLLKIKDSK